jgi:chromosomal replication initiator protein
VEGVAAAELEQLWEEIREDLRASVLESTFDLWLAALRPATMRGDVLFLTAPAPTISWVERRYGSLISATAGGRLPGLRMVELLPAGEDSELDDEAPQASSLHPEHTFDRFVIGPGTRLAHAAALAVAEAPGEAYNPLFLYGPPGLGKTHLLGAIGNYVAAANPSAGVYFTTAERFTSEFVGALRAEGLDEFKRRHRELDLLLIDDVQSIAGRERTAEELFHTFNALHDAGSQIVLSSDRPPAEVQPLTERLRDRFEWGLLAELEPPDFATRQTILRRLVHESELPLHDTSKLDTLAARLKGNVRQLQGALTRAVAIASLHGKPLDETVAAGHPSDAPPPPGGPTPESIAAVVARRLGLAPADLTGPSRRPDVVRARHLALYLSRELTGLSLPRIGAAFDRDHSTVLSAIRKLKRDSASDRELAELLHTLRSELSPGSSEPHGDRSHCENRSSANNRGPQGDSLLAPRIDSNSQDQPLSSD